MNSSAEIHPFPPHSVAERVGKLDWPDIERQLDARGFAVITGLLEAGECAAIVAMYDQAERFRSRVVMRRHGFGEGEYQYFGYPLPEPVASLRRIVYPHLAPLANRWSAALRSDARYPDAHQDYIDLCHRAGQRRPTPLLLKYGPGDYNRLHQDLYGELYFPLQMAILLSRPTSDFTGGEFVMTEQKPRSQSRVEVAPLGRGDAVIFAVNHRPVMGTNGYYRVVMRHGVSTLRSGSRHCLGVIFHDAT